MYKFHYKCIGTKYDSSARFSFTDTGSLVYEIETDDVYEDFYKKKKTIYLTLKIILKIQTYLILSIKKWKMKSKEK